MTNKSGIYMIMNIQSPVKKLYIGSAVDIDKRLKGHKRDLQKNKHYNMKLQNAWNKYGEDSFIFCVIERVKNVDNLIKREQYWINKSDSCRTGYNIRPVVEGRFVCSDEMKSKNAEAHKGMNNVRYGRRHSTETRIKMSRFAKGRKMSVETKEKLSKINRGHVISKEARRKISMSNKGRHLSEETKKKISEAMKGNIWSRGRIVSEVTKKKLSKAMKGKIRSKEHKKNLSKALKGKMSGEKNPFYGRHHSEESKKKMSITHKFQRVTEDIKLEEGK